MISPFDLILIDLLFAYLVAFVKKVQSEKVKPSSPRSTIRGGGVKSSK